jgi:hypothetical protein
MPGTFSTRCKIDDQSLNGCFYRLYFTVRHHRQNAIFQLALKTVHGAQADDQHRYAQRDTYGGNHRDQRHHAAALAPTAEAQGRQKRK